jgi:hypothetical protein
LLNAATRPAAAQAQEPVSLPPLAVDAAGLTVADI